MRSSLRSYLRLARTGLGPVVLGARRFSPTDQATFAASTNHTNGRHVRVLALSLGALNLLTASPTT